MSRPGIRKVGRAAMAILLVVIALAMLEQRWLLAGGCTVGIVLIRFFCLGPRRNPDEEP